MNIKEKPDLCHGLPSRKTGTLRGLIPGRPLFLFLLHL